MHVNMCHVCVCVRVCVCVCVCQHISHDFVLLWLQHSKWTCESMQVNMCECISQAFIQASVCFFGCSDMSTCESMHMNMCVCIYVCMYIPSPYPRNRVLLWLQRYVYMCRYACIHVGVILYLLVLIWQQ